MTNVSEINPNADWCPWCGKVRGWKGRHEGADMNIKELKDVQHYTGGEKCSYVDCDDIAEFVVQGVDGTKTYTFVGCEECLNDAKIYPLENEWVDERTDKRRNA